MGLGSYWSYIGVILGLLGSHWRRGLDRYVAILDSSPTIPYIITRGRHIRAYVEDSCRVIKGDTRSSYYGSHDHRQAQ